METFFSIYFLKIILIWSKKKLAKSSPSLVITSSSRVWNPYRSPKNNALQLVSWYIKLEEDILLFHVRKFFSLQSIPSLNLFWICPFSAMFAFFHWLTKNQANMVDNWKNQTSIIKQLQVYHYLVKSRHQSSILNPI